jgi:LysM repeat protein
VAGLLLTTRVAAAGEDGVAIPVSHHVVAEGETLWAIAGEVAPDRDRRETIADIVELNALPDATVHPGEQIAVPLYE